MRDSSVVKEHDILKNSRIAQLACLDSVMEQCVRNESDPTVHRLKRKVDNAKDYMETLKAEFEAKLELQGQELTKDDDGIYEYTHQFDQAFSSKEEVDKVRQDGTAIYGGMVRSIGRLRMRSGMHPGNNAFFLSKKKTYSRAFLKEMPQLGIRPKEDL